MRYVIISVVKGSAGEFNNKLRKELFSKFKVKSSKLPAHFTIKSPFEYNGCISDLEECINNFCKYENPEGYTIEGYNHFDNRVIYMDVNMSDKGKALHDKLVDKLDKIPYINFTEIDGKNKIFHVTLSSKKIQSIYDILWDYINKYKCNFNCKFDNISIYKWENNTWVLHKEYTIGLL